MPNQTNPKYVCVCERERERERERDMSGKKMNKEIKNKYLNEIVK